MYLEPYSVYTYIYKVVSTIYIFIYKMYIDIVLCILWLQKVSKVYCNTLTNKSVHLPRCSTLTTEHCYLRLQLYTQATLHDLTL